MVETREREVIYTDAPSDGPSTVLVVLFSLLVIGVLGFMIYYFSNNNMSNPMTVIERNTTTTNTVPMPTPVPSAPINITPPSTNSGSSGSSSPLGDMGSGNSSSSSSGSSQP
jgi:hypothetical protein